MKQTVRTATIAGGALLAILAGYSMPSLAQPASACEITLPDQEAEQVVFRRDASRPSNFEIATFMSRDWKEGYRGVQIVLYRDHDAPQKIFGKASLYRTVFTRYATKDAPEVTTEVPTERQLITQEFAIDQGKGETGSTIRDSNGNALATVRCGK